MGRQPSAAFVWEQFTNFDRCLNRLELSSLYGYRHRKKRAVNKTVLTHCGHSDQASIRVGRPETFSAILPAARDFLPRFPAFCQFSSWLILSRVAIFSRPTLDNRRGRCCRVNILSRIQSATRMVETRMSERNTVVTSLDACRMRA